MDNRERKFTIEAPPKFNNGTLEFGLLVVNLLLSWLLNPERRDYYAIDIMDDALFSTSFIVIATIAMARAVVAKSRALGLPVASAPANRFLMFLPKGFFGMTVFSILLFAPLVAYVNISIYLGFGFRWWTFFQFMLFKMIYCAVLAQGLIRLYVFRLTQPDCVPVSEGRPL